MTPRPTRFSMVPGASESHTILVTRFSAIGDVAMTIPVVYGAALAGPSVSFVAVTRQSLTSMWVNPPRNVTIVGINLDNYRGVKGMWRLAGELYRDFHPSAMADLHDVTRTKLLRFFLRLKRVKVAVIDKGRREKRRLTKVGAAACQPLRPMTTRYREVFNNLGISIPVISGALPGLRSDGNPGGIEIPRDVPTVGIAPFAAHPGKIYPPEKVAKVIDNILNEQPRAHIYLFGGGGDEKEKLDAIAASHPGSVISIAGRKLGFEREMELMSKLDVMLTMDSANMHLATLAGTRVVSLWGATHPAAGFAPEDVDIIQRDLPCRPCSVYGNRPCRLGDYRCLDIDPAVVTSRILKWL